MKLNRIIRKRLHDADGNVRGDLSAVLAANVGESGGSEAHVRSHTRIVQTSRGGQTRTSTSTDKPAEPDDPKEAA
jgi:hypothetical protein